jgi:hypothetical protein
MNLSPVDLYHQSYSHLHDGNYETGFKLFEHRWNSQVIATMDEPFKKLTPQPTWKGQPLYGRSVTIQMEMGYGDCIQFARFLPLLKVMGVSHITVLQTKSLHNLISQFECVNHITNNEKSDQASKTDYWIGSMSLPNIALSAPSYVKALFPITKTHVVGSNGYLDAKTSDIKPMVGVNWSASKRYLHVIKSIDAQLMKELVPDAYSLNPEDDADFTSLPDNGWKGDWQKTSEHMKAMKAVVTVDTGTAHLAGALGVKCIVLLPEDDYVCWRWKNATWYDSVITLRKHEWDQVPNLLKGH